MKNSNRFSLFLINLSLSLKKKILHHKKTNNMILKLKNSLTDKQANKKLNMSLIKSAYLETLTKQSFGIVYAIHFFFSSINTFLYVTDSSGALKFKYSAGLMKFKGKQKKNRYLVLKSFFKELRKLKISILKNKTVSLNLTNVGSYKYFIAKKVKKLFIIKFIKSYQVHAYNGCRKKKRLRKK